MEEKAEKSSSVGRSGRFVLTLVERESNHLARYHFVVCVPYSNGGVPYSKESH